MFEPQRTVLGITPRGLTFGQDTLLTRMKADGTLPVEDEADRVAVLLGVAYGQPVGESWIAKISMAARSWNAGHQARALIGLAQVGLPGPDVERLDTLGKVEKALDEGCSAEVLLKAIHVGHSVAGEPRVPAGNPGLGGRWTDADASGSENNGLASHAIPQIVIHPKHPPLDATALKKQRFVAAHLAAAEAAARTLNVPVANILGLSALESGWGEGPFARDGGNNYLGCIIRHRVTPATASHISPVKRFPPLRAMRLPECLHYKIWTSGAGSK